MNLTGNQHIQAARRRSCWWTYCLSIVVTLGLGLGLAIEGSLPNLLATKNVSPHSGSGQVLSAETQLQGHSGISVAMWAACAAILLAVVLNVVLKRNRLNSSIDTARGMPLLIICLFLTVAAVLVSTVIYDVLEPGTDVGIRSFGVLVMLGCACGLIVVLRLRSDSDHRIIEQQHKALVEANGELDFVRRALDEHAIVAMTDANGRITHANDLFCKISGYSRDELIGHDHRIVNSGYHPRSFFSEMYHTIHSGHVWRGLIRNRAKSGDVYWVQATIVPDMNEEGRARQFLAIRTNVTELKNLESRLTQVNRELGRRTDEMKTFVYSVSHDLKAPLVTILGYAALIEKDAGKLQPGVVLEHCDRLKRAAEHLKRKVDGLLQLSQIECVGRDCSWIRTVDIWDELKALFAIQFAERQVDVHLDFATERLFGSRQRVIEALQNLISNALRYGCRNSCAQIEIGSRVGDDSVLLYVRDHGPGIHREHHNRIFNTFERLNTSIDGTGIGLAVVRRAAEAHGGRAWVESTLGAGATFWIMFPNGSEATVDETRLCATA